jgi:hypothetical protein
MRLHNNHTHHNQEPDPSHATKRLTKNEMHIAGIVVYIIALAMFLAMAVALMLFGTGRIMHAQSKNDMRQVGGTASAEQKNKLAELTQPFPTPRAHPEDTNEDIAELHAHEDLLLDHYSWVEREHGKVRIPIERALELIAQRGLPTALPVEKAPLMTADSKQVVSEPLTSGFVRTENEELKAK